MDEKQEENNEDLKIKGNKALKAKTSSFQFFASFFSRQKIYHISPRPNKTNYIQIKLKQLTLFTRKNSFIFKD